MRFIYALILLCFAVPLCADFNEAKFDLTRATHEKKSLLITGCGRSGTGFMAAFLNASGYEVGHETMKEKGTVSWLTGAMVDSAPWGPLLKDYRFRRIYQQVRDPIKVIQSMYNVPPPG